MRQKKIFSYLAQSVLCLCFALVLVLYGQRPLAYALEEASALNAQKNILYISAFTSSYTWDVEIMQAVRTRLRDAGFEVQLHEEFLNLRSIEDKEKVFTILNELYVEKYKNIEFDLVIANEEIDFMLTHGKKIFSDTPMLFCALERNTYESLKHIKNISATIDVRKPEKVIDFLMASQPNVQNILVIMDNSVGSTVVIPNIQAIAKKYPAITFSYIQPLDINELIVSLKGLPVNTVLLDTSYFSSPPTNAVLHDQRKAIAYELTGLPLFTIWNKAVGFGAIAGQDVPTKEHGKALGNLAVAILQQGSAMGVPSIFVENSPLLVDYNMLRHFGISESLIPHEAIVLNKPQSFYQKHRNSILLLIVCCSIGFICIFFLLIALQQKRVEKRILLAALENQKKEQKIQEQRSYLETMETLAAFSSGIAHDINGVLQVIAACSELIEEDLAPDSVLHQDIKKIQEMSQRGQGILHKITLQPTQDLQAKSNSLLADELERLLPLLRSMLSESCQLRYDNTFQDAYISLHSEEIYQLFYNLCSNAMQAMSSAGGEIYIHITSAENVKNSQENFVHITIQDTGNGIDPEHIKHIFKPYYTTKKQQGHFGLGLFSLQSMVVAHCGSITVQSQQGQGTVFHIQLPCV